LTEMLRRLGFVLIRAGEIRHKRYVNVQAVARPNFVTNLTMASRNGWLSMSPIVPPISVMTTSACVASATL
jgi:hypothetical protein